MKLSHQVQELPEDFLVGCFVGGLRDAIKYEIIAKNPNTIEEAMRLARVEEEKINNQRKEFKSTFQKPVGSSGGGGLPAKPSGGATNPQPFSTVRRLSPQELREKRDKGLCFHYDKKYVAGHKCKHQKLFKLEIYPEGGEEEAEWGFEEEESGEPRPPIELSANLMAGVLGVSSIRLIGKILGKEVSLLVDSGATHNFIDPATAKRIGLPLQAVNSFEVEVADGGKMEGKAWGKNIS